MARRVFLDAPTLRHLFVERSGLLGRCTPEQLDAIRHRWGDVLFEEVTVGEMADLTLA
jgi:hypothetical protein